MKVNIIIGRFQPLTNGHLKCIKEVWDDAGVPTIIAMIETSSADSRHPFLSKQLVPLYKRMFKNNAMIADIVTVKNADIVKLGEMLGGMGYEICSWVCGDDRYDKYKYMADRYHDQAHLTDDFKMIRIMRNDVSATLARQYLYEDNLLSFKEITPFSTYMFHLFRKKLLELDAQ